MKGTMLIVMKTLSLTCCCLIASGRANGQVKTPSVIGDNMVLQRGMEVPIWGSASPGERVTVKMAGKVAEATADKNGRWGVKIGPFDAGGPHEMTIAGRNPVTYRNVLVGEVWVCSGQSNMEWPMNATMNATEEIAAASYPKIRLFHVPRTSAATPQEDVEGSWKETTPDSVRDFSAVGYFFGRHLHKELGVPVGLINSSWGGTAAEWWTTPGTLEKDPDLLHIVEDWRKLVEGYEESLKDYQAFLERWEETTKKTGMEGKPTPPNPPDPNTRPGGLYNGMIAPLIPYGIRGVTWYQGETNAGRAFEYRKLFPAMIRDWREHWGEGDFPFLFVQLANFGERKPEPGESAWAELREAQSMTLSLPNTAMAIIIDIGEANDIHPKNKQDVGKRLALAALGMVHGKELVWSGPTYKSMKAEGKKVRVSFDHVDGGLEAKGGELKGFAVAGEDRRFVWANAKIEGENVVVWSDGVENPVAVRYAWADDPEATLYNAAGLPASPFRTDDWPGVTWPKEKGGGQ